MPTTIDIESQRMFLGSTPVRKIYRGTSLLGMRIAELFAQGEPGVWYDPSDFSTLFQDPAGTTPVTAVEQPVGLMLDKSGNGNHAYQTTATSRPVLSARKNLTTASESVGNTSPWSISASQYVITSNAATAPDGTMTADLLTSTGTPGTPLHLWVATVTTFTVSFYVKQGTKSSVDVLVRNHTTSTNIASGTYHFTTGKTTGSWTAEDVGNGWTRLKATVGSGVAVGDTVRIYVGATGGIPANESWYVWGVQVEAGATATRYQRVNTATDYDTAGFPHYLHFDGVDDWMVTNTITPGTDKVQVFAGGSKNSDIAFPVLVENSTDPSINNGTFSLSPRQDGAMEGATFRTKGTIQSIVNMLGLVAPTKFVLSGIGSISEDVVALRSGGVEVIRGLADQGTGDFLDYPIYLGSRAGTSLWFNGHLYSLIVRFGSNLPAATIEKTEKYINQKTRAY